MEILQVKALFVRKKNLTQDQKENFNPTAVITRPTKNLSARKVAAVRDESRMETRRGKTHLVQRENHIQDPEEDSNPISVTNLRGKRNLSSAREKTFLLLGGKSPALKKSSARIGPPTR